MRVCASCGTIAPTSKEECAVCFSRFEGSVLEVEPPGEGLGWARVSGGFKCRSCGFDVALNGLSYSGAVVCGSCGIRQAFSGEIWGDIVEFVHSVADLTGHRRPEPDSALWPAIAEETFEETAALYKRIGRDRCVLEKSSGAFSDDLDWAMEASPGHPTCGMCKALMKVRLEGRETICECPSCGAERRYVLSEEEAALPGVVGVIAEAHESSTPQVKEERSAGGAAVALTCPNCSGALDAAKVGETVVCSFCGVTSRIPARLMQRITGEPEKKQPWWILFEGESPLRRAAQERVTREARSREFRRQQRIAQRAEEEAEAEQRRRAGRRNGIIIAAVVFLGVAGLLALILSNS